MKSLGFKNIDIGVYVTNKLDVLINEIAVNVLSFLETMFVTTIYLTYFLCTRARPGDAGGVWSRIDRDIQRFVILKAYLSLFIAVLVTFTYMYLNVGLAIVWGILTFILNWFTIFISIFNLSKTYYNF